MSNNKLNQKPNSKDSPHQQKTLITNLSKTKLRKVETNVLTKGLNFVPTPNLKHLEEDIKTGLYEFFNIISTKYFFAKQQKHKQIPALYRKTYWTAPIPKKQ